MLEDELSVSTRERDGVAIIDLVGDVTTFAEEKINSAYTQVTGQGAKHVLLNFRQNDYINSAGIAWRSMPISTRTRMRRSRVSPPPQPDKMTR